MRADVSTIVLLTQGSIAHAQEFKHFATQAPEAIAPIAQTAGSATGRIAPEFIKGTDSKSGEGARTNLKMQDKRERKANRGVRKNDGMVKPRNGINSEVKNAQNACEKTMAPTFPNLTLTI